jgi:RNA polymerase sigma-70 factor, ECF subfamily
MKSEQELVHALKEGDEKAFEQVFNQYYDGLCLFAESITRSHSVAEDIVEELFLQIWINCRINPIETSVKSYLYQSVYNNSIRYTARQKKNNVRIGDPEENDQEWKTAALFSSDYPIANLITRELEEKARQVIESLPDQCRQVYQLNRDNNLKYHEIAQRLDISESTVKTQMRRAFSKLRKELKEFLYLFI